VKNRIVSITLVVALILSGGLIGCAGEGVPEIPEIPEYNLAISSTEGGEVTTPGEGTFTYDEGAVVDLVAQPEEGYHFVKWTGLVDVITDVYAAETTITMNYSCYITANFAIQIRDWYDLNAIRDNLNGNYLLMNDLDSTTAGYTELASPTANGRKGWEPIGSLSVDLFTFYSVGPVDPFTGSLDGQGYEIRDLFINRPDEDGVGLFGCVGWYQDFAGGGVITNLGVVDAEVTGRSHVGGLVGGNWDTVSNSYSTGRVAGYWSVGGLVGWIGYRWGTMSNSHYNYDEVLINGKNIITIGALFNEDFDQWLANDKFLDVNERLSQEDGYYVINDVSDFKQLLAFGQDDSLKFILKNDLDLSGDPNFYIPYLAGEFDGNGHKISNLRLNFDSISQVGLFGCLALGGKVNQLGVENVNVAVTGAQEVGGLVGGNSGTVSNSYSTGSVTGDGHVGGLAGVNWHTVSNSYSTGSVTGGWGVGGLVGLNGWGLVSNSYATGSVTGDGHVGGLVGTNFMTVSNSYSTGSVTGGWGVGGLVGFNAPACSVGNCYSTGRVSGDGYVGGLVGYNENEITVRDSFWNHETGRRYTSAGGTSKTTAEMQEIATFADTETQGLDQPWDITAVATGETNDAYTWNIVDGQTYPFLSWQSTT
jgi:hypothetical protein